MKRGIIYVTLTLFSATVAVTMCSGDSDDTDNSCSVIETSGTTVAIETADSPATDATAEAAPDCLSEILRYEMPYNPYIEHFDSMPPGGRRLRVNPPGVLGRVFNDSNYLHLQAAALIGITPIDSLANAWNLRRPIAKVTSCREYFIDDLTHSHPYLVPEAATLLKEIGAAFKDSMAARGGGDYRVKVTSVLRTQNSVAGLRRRNRNATSASAHLFGTTFDISYSKFICDSVTVPRTQEDMKNLLAEILADFRRRGRCYIKYERKQACFHITARPSDSAQI